MIGALQALEVAGGASALRAAADGLPVVIVNPTTPVGPGDCKPTPTGKIIVDFLNGRMPAYVDTGLNFVPVEDCAAGHLLAAERGRIGERYILGGENLTLKQMLDMLAVDESGGLRRAGSFRTFWPMLLDTWMRRSRGCWAASRRFRSKACAWRGTACLSTHRRRGANWVLRRGRLQPPWSVRCAGTRRMDMSPRAARSRQCAACARGVDWRCREVAG